VTEFSIVNWRQTVCYGDGLIHPLTKILIESMFGIGSSDFKRNPERIAMSQVGFFYPTIPFCTHCPISFVPLTPLFLCSHSLLSSSPLSSHPFVSFPLSSIPLSLQSFVPPVLCPSSPLSLISLSSHPFVSFPLSLHSFVLSHCVLSLQYLSIVLTIPFHCPSIVLLSLSIILLSSTVHCSY